MKTKKMNVKRIYYIPLIIVTWLQFFIPLENSCLYAQNSPTDLARYTPNWIKDGFVDAGASNEPWIFQVRRNSENFNIWQKDQYEYQLSEEYIKALSESGVTVYHVSGYKGFGFKAEKEFIGQLSFGGSLTNV